MYGHMYVYVCMYVCMYMFYCQGTTVRHSPAILELDLTEGHTIVDRAHSALNLFGHIDVLINNAGELMI